jgi:hypothetical protein
MSGIDREADSRYIVGELKSAEIDVSYMDPRAHLRRNLRFRPPENSWWLYEPDFDFLDEFFGRFSTPNSLLSEP